MAIRHALLPLVLAAATTGSAGGQTRPGRDPPTSRPGTKPAMTLAELQRHEWDQKLQEVALDPTLPPAPLSAVADLRRDGDHLTVLTLQRPTPTLSRIVVDGLPGVCTLNDTLLPHTGRPAPDPDRPTVADFLLFNWFRFDQPDAVLADTFIQVLPANIQVSRLTDAPDDGGTTVLLLERRNATPSPGGEPVVYLKVTDQGGPGRPPAADVSVAADSFGALVRTQPGPVARYLEPVLRDLHADAACLPADPPLEYQVFDADVAVDGPTADRVKQLVARLDADDFRDRDAAGDQLRAMGPIAAVAVGRLDPATFTPEQRARTAALLRQFRPVTDVDAVRLRTDVDFLFNCLNDADPFVTRAALAQLRSTTGHDVKVDDSLRGQARRDAVWQARRSCPRPAPTTRPA